MHRPWVSRERLESEERNRQMFAEQASRLFMELRYRDQEIRGLQERVSALIGSGGSARQLAELFCAFDGDKQATFFSTVAEIAATWPTYTDRMPFYDAAEHQWCYVGSSKELSVAAVEMLEKLVAFAKMERKVFGVMPLDIEVGQLWESRRRESSGKLYRVVETDGCDAEWLRFHGYWTLQPVPHGRKRVLHSDTLRQRYRRLEGQEGAS